MFICAQLRIVTLGQDEIQVRSVAAHDPGVRTFVTACSVNHFASYGDRFHSDKVFPLLLQLDRSDLPTGHILGTAAASTVLPSRQGRRAGARATFVKFGTKRRWRRVWPG